MNTISNKFQKLPKVSVGMPVYNGERFLGQAIESILSQTYSNFELIICDNSSTDSTYDICETFAATDNRISLHKNKSNIGAAKNFNKVFELSSGEYFKWASASDLCEKTFLEICVEILDKYADVCLVIPRTQLIDDNNVVFETCKENLHLMQESSYERFATFRERLRLNNAEQGLIRSNILNKTNLQSVYPNSDVILMAEIVARGKAYQTQEYLFSRRHTASSTTNFMTESEVANFYSPNKTYIPHQTLRTFFDFLKLSIKLPISFAERLKFFLFALRFLRWGRKSLALDFYNYFQEKFTFLKPKGT